VVIYEEREQGIVMAKRKYGAAQKHFDKLAGKLRKEVADAQKECVLLSQKVEKLKAENEVLKYENQQSKDWIERLLEYTKLGEADIKIACEKDKEMASLTSVLRQFANLI